MSKKTYWCKVKLMNNSNRIIEIASDKLMPNNLNIGAYYEFQNGIRGKIGCQLISIEDEIENNENDAQVNMPDKNDIDAMMKYHGVSWHDFI